MTTKYDAIIAGAGPTGSTAARLLARGGAKVLLLDRATFPRDKPCGGGVTFRADEANDLDLAPVSEREIFGVRISFKLGRPFERTSTRLLARMTQRSRLDNFLAEAAASAGAEFRDGHAARSIEIDGRTARVRSNGDVYEAPVLIGADGINGMTARALSIAAAEEHAVAFEATYPLDAPLAEHWARHVALDLGGTPGGYGWVFPKGDHLNVGVGGWKHIGPTLRKRLERLCASYGLDASRLTGHRGYQLPLRDDRAAVVRGPAMLAGDAAALVDPLSGEGIWAAFVSGRLAAEEARRYLAGDVRDLGGYQAALDEVMRDEIVASRRLQGVFQRAPRLSALMMRGNPLFWRYLVQVIRGELTYPELPRKLGPLGWVFNRWGDMEIALHRRDLRSRARRHDALPR